MQFKRSLTYRGRAGDRTGKGFTLYGMGLVHACLEQYDEAEAAFRESMAIRESIDDARGVSHCLYGLGLVAFGRGDLEEAEAMLQQAREQHEALALKGDLVADLSWLGQVYLAMGRLEEALTCSQEAMDLLAGQKAVEEVQQIYLNHYRVLRAAGDPGAADALRQAHDAVSRQADAITDPAMRAGFLQKVRVNREIAAEMAGAGEQRRRGIRVYPKNALSEYLDKGLKPLVGNSRIDT